MFYLKIINTLSRTIYESYSKLYKELKNVIQILVGQAVFKLWIKIVKMLFGSITQEPLDLPKVLMLFLSSLDNLPYDAYIIYQKRC